LYPVIQTFLNTKFLNKISLCLCLCKNEEYGRLSAETMIVVEILFINHAILMDVYSILASGTWFLQWVKSSIFVGTLGNDKS